MSGRCGGFATEHAPVVRCIQPRVTLQTLVSSNPLCSVGAKRHQQHRSRCCCAGCTDSLYAGIAPSRFPTTKDLSRTTPTHVVQVNKGLSGIPVTDEDGMLLGEVSGFDIIALDTTPGHVDTTDGMFPKIGRCEDYNGDVTKMWGNFLELQEIAAQANSSTVGQIMSTALSIPKSTTLEAAAWWVARPLHYFRAVMRLYRGGACLYANRARGCGANSMVVEKKAYRMSVLDDDGR